MGQLGELRTAAEEQIRISASAAAATGIARMTAHLDARGRAMDEHLEDSHRRILQFTDRVDQLFEAAVEVAANNSTLMQEIREDAAEKLDNLIKRTETLLKELLKRGEDQSAQIVDRAQALLTEARRQSRAAGWRPWAMATCMACVLLTVLTVLRPGWTMSAEQRRALRVGEAVIYTYSSATVPERKEMRRVMRWRTPEHPDSTEAPQVQSPR